ncbi:MAG: hypothetical protein IT440_01100 [Phycisphaeraceae bacterium]|nr:hypothetical protein [Phycisphaeraceae bacterium]
MFRKPLIGLSFIAAPLLMFGVLTAVPAIVQAADATLEQKAMMAEGTVRSVDADQHTFVLAIPDQEPLPLKYDDNTKFTDDGELPVKPDILKAGVKVRVSYENDLATQVSLIR